MQEQNQPMNSYNPGVAPVRGSKLLKVTGILMIVFGGISLVTSFIGRAAMAFLSALAAETEYEGAAKTLSTMSTLSLIISIIVLTAGILGVVFWKKPEKAMVNLIFGALIIVLTLVSGISSIGAINSLAGTTMAGAGGSVTSTIISMVIGLALPVLYVIGALQNKKLSA